MQLRRGLLVVLPLLAIACAERPQPQMGGAQQVVPTMASPTLSPGEAGMSTGAIGDGSSSEENLSSYLRGKGVTVPHRTVVTDPMELTVRPDVLRVRFAVRAVRATSSESLGVARETSARIAEQFRRKFQGTTSFRGMDLKEVVQEQQVVGTAVTADGVVDVPLGESLDFWKRSDRYVRVVALAKEIATKNGSPDGKLKLNFSPPEIVVSDPEAHRDELIERWVARAKAFARAAESEGAPLSVVGCEAPSAVAQSPVSVDEVTLGLDVQCVIDVPGHGHGAYIEGQVARTVERL